jgi:hypothetical protein
LPYTTLFRAMSNTTCLFGWRQTGGC